MNEISLIGGVALSGLPLYATMRSGVESSSWRELGTKSPELFKATDQTSFFWAPKLEKSSFQREK
jgi:hypothetical protein